MSVELSTVRTLQPASLEVTAIANERLSQVLSLSGWCVGSYDDEETSRVSPPIPLSPVGVFLLQTQTRIHTAGTTAMWSGDWPPRAKAGRQGR